MPAHRHPHELIVLYVVAGALEVEIGTETYALEAEDIARFHGDQDIAPHATADTTALIVFVPR